MLPFQPQNQVGGGNNPSLNQLPRSTGAVPNQFSFNNSLVPTMGEFHNQNALLGTLIVQQQLIQGLQNNLMAALSQQGAIPQFNGQHLNLLGGLQNQNMMSLQPGGFLGRPTLNQNLNQAMRCSSNGFLSSQNPNFASNSQLPVMNSVNPNPIFLGNGNPQVAQNISNSPCLKAQIASQNLQDGFRSSQNPNFASNSQLPVMNSVNPNPIFLGNGNPQVAQNISNSPCLKAQIASQNLQDGFLSSQNPNFASNSQLPVMNSVNPNPIFLGNGNPQIAQNISNSPCLKAQIASQNLQESVLKIPMQNNQFNGCQWPQITHSQAGGKNFSNNSTESAANNNFKPKINGFGKMGQSHMRFQKPQSYSSSKAWKNEGSFPRNDGRGQRPRNERNTKLSENNHNTSIMLKRPLAVIYNESEVQQWREARKKNFPTRVNIEKKLMPSGVREDIDSDAKVRRQQLKEILAKQAELGVEVAEIPSTYLDESEEQASRNMNGSKASNTNTQNSNKHFNNKRGRFQREHRNAKRLKFKDKALPAPAHAPVVKKREPTLLRKLLNTDIRRDKSQLLQAFRFILLNSFFQNSPGKPLVFPTIIAKDETAPVVAEKLLQNDVTRIEDASTPKSGLAVESVVKNVSDEEETESDSDDIDGASDVVCEAIGEDFAAGGEKSEEGEITD